MVSPLSAPNPTTPSQETKPSKCKSDSTHRFPVEPSPDTKDEHKPSSSPSQSQQLTSSLGQLVSNLENITDRHCSVVQEPCATLEREDCLLVALSYSSY